MIYASAVRSKYPRPGAGDPYKEGPGIKGVVGVFTANDIPGDIKVGHLKQDWDALIPVGGMTHYLGDAICLVAAESMEVLEEAKSLVEVDYEVQEGGIRTHSRPLKKALQRFMKAAILAHEHLIRRRRPGKSPGQSIR